METNDIQLAQSHGGALVTSDYQTFEMAKENDSILGGDDIAQIRSYAAYARAQAQAIHKTIAATNGIDDVAAIKQEALETEQTFAKVGLYADQRIGELLRELPTSNRWSDSPTGKTETIEDSGMSLKTAYQLEQLAANPDVVQAVLDKAEAEGRVASRKQVLDAIRERKLAEQERDKARQDLADAYRSAELMESEVASLKRQVAAKPQPEVIEREVVREVPPADYEDLKKRASSLQREADRLTREYREMWQKKQEAESRLEQANELLGEKGRNDNAQRDIEQLTAATNAYLRQYGGKAWAFDQFHRVDEVTQEEFVKAINNMFAFAQNLSAMVTDRKQIGEN